MRVYRLTRAMHAGKLDGAGAARWGSRWNSPGTALLFCAQSRALALCETIVHAYGTGAGDRSYALVELDIPGRSVLRAPRMPETLKGSPDNPETRAIGDGFVKHGKHLAMRLPSVLVPEEHNFIINPAHPHFRHVRLVSILPFELDARFLPER